MGVRKNSFVVNSIISHFPVKWEVFLLNFFKRQSCCGTDMAQTWPKMNVIISITNRYLAEPYG